jgi:hypothetical protein
MRAITLFSIFWADPLTEMTEWGMRFRPDFTFVRLREMQLLRSPHGNEATRQPVWPSNLPPRKAAPVQPLPVSSPRWQPIGIVRGVRVCDFNTQLVSHDVPLVRTATLPHGNRRLLWAIAAEPAMPKAKTLPNELRSPREGI